MYMSVFLTHFSFSTPEQEQLMVIWLSWMIKEEEYFERYCKSAWTVLWNYAFLSISKMAHLLGCSQYALVSIYQK